MATCGMVLIAVLCWLLAGLAFEVARAEYYIVRPPWEMDMTDWPADYDTSAYCGIAQSTQECGTVDNGHQQAKGERQAQ